MSSIPAVLGRPSPRQARKLRRHLRETQPEVHATLKALRREQRRKKSEGIAVYVDHTRKVWVGICKVKGRHLDKDGNVDVRRFPGAFTPSPRRSFKWIKRKLRKERGTTRTISPKVGRRGLS